MPLPFLAILGAIGAAASVAGTVASVRQQNKAAELSQQQEILQNRYNRRRAIREMQIARASSLASAAGAGAGFGSGVAGGIGGLSSQLGADLGFSSQMSGLSGRINEASRLATTYGGIAQLGGSAFGFAQQRGFGGGFNLGGQAPTAAPTPAVVSGYTPYSGTRPQARPATPTPTPWTGYR